jgi:hypothetical protein
MDAPRLRVLIRAEQTAQHEHPDASESSGVPQRRHAPSLPGFGGDQLPVGIAR